MKTKTVFAVLLAVIFIAGGCKKEGNGKKEIVGTVYFNDGVSPIDDIAPGASVYITYDSKVATGNVDETVTSDSKGAYVLKGLKDGDYFISAEYTTSHGFKYSTPGHGVIVAPGKDKVDLNIRLY